MTCFFKAAFLAIYWFYIIHFVQYLHIAYPNTLANNLQSSFNSDHSVGLAVKNAQ